MKRPFFADSTVAATVCSLLAFGIAGCSDSGTEPPPPASDVPTASPATNVTDTGFTARWTAVQGALAYRLDVSGDSLFGSFLSGFNSKDVGNTTSSAVTGLTTGGRYFYRVRGVTAAGTSASSNTVGVTVRAPTGVSFQNDVRPIFSARGCIGCHGGSGGLFLETVSNLLSTGNHTPVVIAGNGAGSVLIRKLGPTPPFGSRMPLGGQPLPTAEIQIIQTWIDQGAQDN